MEKVGALDFVIGRLGGEWKYNGLGQRSVGMMNVWNFVGEFIGGCVLTLR